MPTKEEIPKESAFKGKHGEIGGVQEPLLKSTSERNRKELVYT